MTDRLKEAPAAEDLECSTPVTVADLGPLEEAAPVGVPSSALGEGLYLKHFCEMIAGLLAERVDAVVEQLTDKAENLMRAGTHRGVAMITERELAALLRCAPRTIRRLEQSGGIPAACRIGGVKRWRLTAVRRWLDGLEQRRNR